jgi:hypothetical protein
MMSDNFTEDPRQVGALEPFAPKIREILLGYRKKRKLSSIAKKIGVHPSRLTEFITKDGEGRYKRTITPYYLAKLINDGVVTVSQILDDKKLEDLPDRARLYLERMALSRQTIQIVLEAQHRGIDVDAILKNILYPVPKK